MKTGGSLRGILQAKPVLLVAIPLVFLFGIIAAASQGNNGDKAHKTNVAITDDADSTDGSLAGDYVVAEDEKDTANTDNPKTPTATPTPTKPSSNSTTKNTNSTKPSKPKPTKPKPIKKPTKPVIGTPPTKPQPLIKLLTRKTFASTAYVVVADTTIKQLPAAKAASSTVYKKNKIITGIVELRTYSNGQKFYLTKSQVDAGAKTGFLSGVLKYIKIGTLCTIKDSSLDEASGAVASRKYPTIVYTHNDEGISSGKGRILAIDTSNCAVKARIDVNNLRSDPDPEAITIDQTTGKIWFGDIGNGHPGQTSSMTDKKKELKYPSLAARIVVFSEPSSLKSMSISTKKYDITYEGGNQNAEALLVNPKTGQGYIINKYSTTRVYKLPYPLKSGVAKRISASVVPWVTDATFTNDGQRILVRYRTTTDAAPTKVLVYSATTWKKIGCYSVPRVKQGESLTIEKNSESFIFGSEKLNSPLVRTPIYDKYNCS